MRDATSPSLSTPTLADKLALFRAVRIAPNRAAAPRDLQYGQNERLSDLAIQRFCNS